MRIIICGAGRVGQGIARRLASEKHDVIMIDENANLIDDVSTDLDVRGIVGHAAYPDTLKRAGADDAEMIIAVTHYDEINMVICQIADALFGVPNKVARVRAQAYLDKKWKDLFSRTGLPIDMVISPEVEVGEAILQRFRSPGAIMSADIASGRLQLLGYEIDGSSPLVETALDQFEGLFPDLDAKIIGIGRGAEVSAPKSNDILQVGDRAYIALRREHARRLNGILGRDDPELRHIVIVGAGNVGLHLAKLLEKDKSVRIRLIEQHEETAERAVSILKRSIIIRGDALSPAILEEAGCISANLVVALTDDDKTNLLIGNLAKNAGAQSVLALVNSVDLAALGKDMNVDAVLDPRALTVSQILMRLRRGRIVSLHSIEDGKAEVAEGIIMETSPLIGKSINYDDLPDGVTAAAIVRDDEVLFPSDTLRVRAGDHLIIFYEDHMTRKVEQFFRVSADFF